MTTLAALRESLYLSRLRREADGSIDLAPLLHDLQPWGTIHVDTDVALAPVTFTRPVRVVGRGVIRQIDPAQPVMGFTHSGELNCTVIGHPTQYLSQRSQRLVQAAVKDGWIAGHVPVRDRRSFTVGGRFLGAPAWGVGILGYDEVHLDRPVFEDTRGLSLMLERCREVTMDNPSGYRIGFPGGNEAGAAGALILTLNCWSVTGSLTVDQCSDSPGYFTGTPYLHITGGNLTGNAKTGLKWQLGDIRIPDPRFIHGRSCVIENLTVEDTGWNPLSVHLSNVAGGSLSNITIVNNTIICPRAPRDRLYFARNEAAEGKAAGIRVIDARNVNVLDNTVHLDGSGGADGIEALRSANVQIRGNRVLGQVLPGHHGIICGGRQKREGERTRSLISDNFVPGGDIYTHGAADLVEVCGNAADTYQHEHVKHATGFVDERNQVLGSVREMR